MDPSETHNFENQWKKAFNEASETPPPSVWEGIEARLNHNEDDKIVPLWWRSPKLWYAAASIVALMLVGGGIWYNNRSGSFKADQVAIASKKSSTPTGKVESAENQAKTLNEIESNRDLNANDADATKELGVKLKSGKINRTPDSDEQLAETSERKSSGIENLAQKSKLKNDQPQLKDERNETDTFIAKNLQKEPSSKNDQFELKSGSKDKVELSQINPSDLEKKTGVPTDVTSKSVVSPTTRSSVTEETVANLSPNIQTELLSSRPYSDLDVFMQKRYVFFKPEIQAEEKTAAPKKPKEYYAGLSLMPASFNPDVNIKEAPMAFASQVASRQKSLTGSNEAGASYAIQTQGGLRFSKHWSMEMGLSYLQGNASYQGGGYVLNAYNNTSSNVLQDAIYGLASTGKNALPSQGFANSSSLYIDVNKKVSNNYQYLQVPVQAGFTLYPDKKLSYSVLGGMMANYFISNELESASGEIITTTASDDIYKSVNWAATTGLRLNYRLSSRWKASLTGSYQKAITSGFRSNQSLESHPYLYGASWGVRYSF